MNAGAYGGEMKDVITRCNHIDFDGNKGHFDAAELDFGYRHSAYSGSDNVIVSVEFEMKKGSADKISAEMNDYWGRRKDKQPLNFPSAGSVFKRASGDISIGKILDELGLKGMRCGNAAISEKHAGFIVNLGGATASDVCALIDRIKGIVKREKGFEPTTEIRFVGFDKC